MFSVYGINGRVFTGTQEQWRQVARVSAPTRTRAIRRADHDDPAADSAVSHKENTGDLQRTAMAAYAQTQQGSAQRRPLTRVADVMSRSIITVPQEATLAQAWQLLARQAIGQAPAVDAAGRLVGLLLRADLLQGSLLPDSGSGALAWRDLLARPVSELMWTPVPCVAPDADLRRVTGVLLETGLPGLPVVDEQGAVTGFVSRSDILRAVVADPPLELWA